MQYRIDKAHSVILFLHSFTTRAKAFVCVQLTRHTHTRTSTHARTHTHKHVGWLDSCHRMDLTPHAETHAHTHSLTYSLSLFFFFPQPNLFLSVSVSFGAFGDFGAPLSPGEREGGRERATLPTVSLTVSLSLTHACECGTLLASEEVACDGVELPRQLCQSEPWGLHGSPINPIHFP